MIGPSLAILGSFSNDNGKSNDDVKKAIGLLQQNNNSARAAHTFVLGSVSKNLIPVKFTCIYILNEFK